MKPLIVLGTGGTCLDIAEAWELSGGTVAGFLDDSLSVNDDYQGFPILGTLGDAPNFATDHWFCNGIGSPRSFRRKPELIAKSGLSPSAFVNVVHPTASVSPRATLGPGAAILQNAVVSANATIGQHVVVLPTSVISHDSVLGDYTSVAGGVIVSGNVRVGQVSYLGAGSLIRDGLNIGERTLIGMGAVVIKDVPTGAVVIGNPGRIR